VRDWTASAELVLDIVTFDRSPQVRHSSSRCLRALNIRKRGHLSSAAGQLVVRDDSNRAKQSRHHKEDHRSLRHTRSHYSIPCHTKRSMNEFRFAKLKRSRRPLISKSVVGGDGGSFFVLLKSVASQMQMPRQQCQTKQRHAWPHQTHHPQCPLARPC